MLRRKRVKKDDEVHFPKPKEIPAMTAVLHSQSLFESLIWCLKSNSTDVFDSSSSSSSAAASVSQMNSLYTPGSRKRGLSVDKTEVVSNKTMKLAHGQSPLVGKQKKSFNYANKPQMNIKVLAATILYVTMEPLDHWPVPLIEAYAEDCFGPRSWVDDPACRPLVQNLTLIHSDNNNHVHEVKNDENHKQQLEADACKVAEFYRMEKEKRNNSKQSQHTKTLSSSSASTPRTSPTFSRVSIQNDNSLNDSDKIPIAPILTKNRSMSVESSESKNTRQLSNSKSEKSKSYMESSHAETTARSLTLNNMAGDESDSGDEEEEEVAIATSFGRPSGVGNGDGSSDGNSSSSGEEEDVCFLDKKSFDEHQISSNAHNPLEESFTSSADIPPPGPELTYPLQQHKLNFTEVRQRYFGHNLESSHQAISEKLSERLDIKSKHNSGLLQCLPSFTSIPSVRSIITANLEKWLQSPALSGLARTLFSITVNSMKNINPPLPADLDALDNILRMRLKANQLNAHVENITAVATKIPTVAVTKHIYGHILREILLSMDSRDSAFSDHLSMIHAVHDVLPGQLSASGIASSILDLLTNPPISFGDLSKSQLVRRIRKLIQAIATKFGSSFDAYKVLDAMLSYQVDPEYLWTIRDEENKARLMFQCVTLLVDLTVVMQRAQPGGKSVKIINPSENDIAIVRAKLIKARKLLLRWCCEDYAPLCPTSSSNKYRRSTPTNGSREKKKGDIVGAGPADYTSILDGLTERDFPDWVNVIRCMLFLENPESPELRQFLAMNDTSVEDDPGWDDEAKRISFCCDFGADIDDAMMWVILDTTTKKENSSPNDIALLVLEHMFEGCKKDKKPSLLLQDAKLLYKLYELVEYIPSVRKKEVMSNDSNGDYCDKICAEKTNEESLSTFSIPRLGYPGMWWRVTGLALIMCGASPDTIGSVALEKFPTLKALIKMITSDRYRFPTVDADEAAREEQKKTEQMMRDEEAKIAEILFAPTQKPKKKTKHKIDAGTEYERSRTSRRQQEKREQELKRQREKEVAEARVEASRRKKLLRAAQKSIMIWDPTKGPRKPPKESADLIFSLEELFDLPRVFRQKSTEPDFLLATIGSTTRGAIERAYDWLIPIISFFPETISRLPASASCFLLLRAYGTEGEERSQLQKLSAPLLEHVRDSLMGKFGEADAVRAFDLLLTDVASHNPDRRRCARRVLHNAIGKENVKDMDETFAGSNHAWAINLMHVEHTKSILGDAVKKLALAASFERGSNLRYLVLALNKLTKLAKENSMSGDWDFASLLIELVSIRPTVFAAALSSFPDLCSLAIHIVIEEFKVYFEGESVKIKSGDIMVCISLCSSPFENGGRVPTKVEMPITLLQSSCVLLSIWFDDDKNEMDSAAIDGLVKMLMKSRESEQGDNSEPKGIDDVDGLAGAKLVSTQKSAIPVESWVMLAKSRSDFIAKRAALTAPTSFLPRLLLCSGLPRASLLTMVDRLGRLGEKAADTNKAFNQLLAPSALSEWDIGRLGHRRDISRKLFGRLSAYSRMYNLLYLNAPDQVSFTFVEWLSDSCQNFQKSTKMKSKKAKVAPAAIFASVESARALFNSLPMDMLHDNDVSTVTQVDADASDMTDFLAFQDKEIISPPERLDDANTIEKFITRIFEENKPDILDKWLDINFSQQPIPMRRKRRYKKEDPPKLSNDELCFLLLQRYILLERKVEGLASALVKWIPKLSASHGSPKFWKTLFTDGQKPSFLWNNLLSRCFQTWNHTHMARCRIWILSEGSKEKLDLLKVVRFLIEASTFSTIHVKNFVDLPLAVEDSAWGRTEDTVRSATGFALDCLVAYDYENRLRSRSDPPECLVLLLLIARLGRNQVQFISGAIMKRIQSENEQAKCWLLLCLLRIYAYFPFSMNLGTSALRSNLKEAVEISADDWLFWRSPLDDSVQDMLDTALSNISSVRSVQTLVDISKKHPLLLLRKLDKLGNVLEKDAVAIDSCVKVGVISGESLKGPLRAVINGKMTKLSVKHWGFSYTEHVWSTILDVVAAVPNEVLFGCALKMGLLDLLGIYLRLVLVQSQLRTSSDRLGKLKEKLSEFLGVFKSTNPVAYDSWMASANCDLPSLGATRNVLVGCGFMSHKQAIESVRKAYSSETKGEN
jgi:integrator complex subunit 1